MESVRNPPKNLESAKQPIYNFMIGQDSYQLTYFLYNNDKISLTAKSMNNNQESKWGAVLVFENFI